MSKKKKKFQKKLRAKVLKEIEQAPKETATFQKPVLPSLEQVETKPKKEEESPQTKPSNFILLDLKRIAWIGSISLAILIIATIISYQTNWLSSLSSTLFKWFGLGQI